MTKSVFDGTPSKLSCMPCMRYHFSLTWYLTSLSLTPPLAKPNLSTSWALGTAWGSSATTPELFLPQEESRPSACDFYQALSGTGPYIYSEASTMLPMYRWENRLTEITMFAQNQLDYKSTFHYTTYLLGYDKYFPLPLTEDLQTLHHRYHQESGGWFLWPRPHNLVSDYSILSLPVTLPSQGLPSGSSTG